MKCVLSHLILFHGVVQMYVRGIYAMTFAAPEAFVAKSLKYTTTSRKTRYSRFRPSAFHRSSYHSYYYISMSNTCSPSEYLDGDISEPSKQSEYVPNEPSVWIDTPTLSNELPTTTTQKKRRARYNGKYPKQYVEKYKELSGDVPTIQKVLQKGMTPAGQHIPIMIDECMEYLGFYAAPTLGSNHDAASHHTIQETYPSNESDVFFVDCTLGYGGHSTHILKHLLTQPSKSSHKMVCFDRDPIEIVKATDRLQKVIAEFCINPNEGDANYQPTSDMVRTVNRNFCELRTHLNEIHGTGKVTALLADLGLSSMQIDDATRGFTYKHEGPLDMRMNGTGNSTESAYDLLQRLSVSELTQILEENSDEIYAPVIAQAIVGDKVHLPSTTLELATVVRDAVRPHLLRNATGNNNKNQRESKISHLPATGKNSATIKKQLDSTVARVMQAIRIEVNAEFDSLQKLLDDLPHILAPKIGRAVFLTFHSGEDRRVKKSFKQGYNDGVYSSWSRDVVRPTSNERYNNPRSSCCKLRWVVRSDKQLS